MARPLDSVRYSSCMLRTKRESGSTDRHREANAMISGNRSGSVLRALLLAGALLVAAQIAGGAAYAAGKDTLVVASGAEAVTLDPGVSFDGQSPLIWRGVYESLLQYKGDTLEIVPALAESYDISPDRLTYTFKIRKGVKFTDGETLDAAAVKFTIERQVAREHGIA